MKKCPKCHAEIEENARFCLYCMTSFEEKKTVETKEKNNKRWLYILAAVLAVAVAVGLVLLLLKAGKSAHEADSAYSEMQSSYKTEAPVFDENQNVAEDDIPKNEDSADDKQNVPDKNEDSGQGEEGDDTSSNRNEDKANTNNSNTEDKKGTSKDEIGTNGSSSGDNATNSGGNNANNSGTGNSNSNADNKKGENGNKSPENNNESGSKTDNNSAGDKNTDTSQGSEEEESSQGYEEEGDSSHDYEKESGTGGNVPEINGGAEDLGKEEESNQTGDENSGKEEENNQTGAEDSTEVPVEKRYEYAEATLDNAYPTGHSEMNAPQGAIVITKIKYIEESGNYVIPDTIDGKKVAAIMPSAFCDASISGTVKSVTLPSTVRTIWNDAFKDCYNLQDIYIKSGTIAIYANAFPETAKRNNTLTFHCSRDCKNFDFYYYRNIVGNYDAEYKEWNG